MTDRARKMSLAKIAAVTVAIIMAIEVVLAVLIIELSTRWFGIMDVVLTPLVLLFYSAPSLLTAFMAARSRSRAAFGVVVVLCIAFVFVLDWMHLMPWNYRHWLGNREDAGMEIFVAVVFVQWPAIVVGLGLWSALNRKKRSTH